MKILPLLALAGGAYFFMNKDKKKATTTSTEVSKFGSKEIGYEVINCTKLTIYDKEKAYKWAFNLGTQQLAKLQDPNYEIDSKLLLFGNCFQFANSESHETKLKNQQKFFDQFRQLLNTKEKAEFILTLTKYLYSGIVSVNADEVDYALARLSALVDAIVSIAKYDVSGLVLDPSDIYLKV